MARPAKRYMYLKDGEVLARGTIKQIAKRLNIPEFRLKNWNKQIVRDRYYAGVGRHCLKEDLGAERIYAFYRGEDWVTMGTIDEIAKFTGLKRETIEWYRAPSAKKRTKVRMVEMEGDADANV